MLDILPIKPFDREINAQIALPGSKSITNRALILAALGEGITRLEGALFSRDTIIMLNALKDLGFKLETNKNEYAIQVEGRNGEIPKNKAKIYVGNAGTVARFLTAFLALKQGGVYELDGDEAMRDRPMSGLLEALEILGAAQFEFLGKLGHFPFILRAKGYHGGVVAVDSRASSQILSALLLCAAKGGSVQLKCDEVRQQYLSLTLEMRESFGAAPVIISEDGKYDIPPAHYKTPNKGRYLIEPDLTAASYFLALILLHGGSLRISNLCDNPLQGDSQFVNVLSIHGLCVDTKLNEWNITRKIPNNIQRGHREIDFNHISDTFLTYAAIAPLLSNSTHITGIGHTRYQETDRVAGMASELFNLGQFVKEDTNALTIQPNPDELRARAIMARKDGKTLNVETYKDHRFAMSFAVLGSYDLLGDGQPWLSIKDPNCCSKTFPDFFKVLESLRDV